MARNAAPLAGSSIRVVARRTGLAPPTLRVWERRYGFPQPMRRGGGSRVYSEEDVTRLQLLARAIDAGFRPGEVVPLPVADVVRLVEAATADAPIADATASTAGVGTGTIDTILAALLDNDFTRVRAQLRTAAVTLGPKTFLVELAHPLMVKVGEAWANGEIEVRHEHLASALLSSQLRLLLGAVDDGTSGSPVVLLATLPDEPHVLGLEMVALYLAASHAVPRFLGPDLPPDQIALAARDLEVDVVGLSIARGADKRSAHEHIRTVRRALPPAIDLWIGGEGGAAALPKNGNAKDGLRVVRSWADLDAALASFRAGSA